jgi:hypothetical protein
VPLREVRKVPISGPVWSSPPHWGTDDRVESIPPIKDAMITHRAEGVRSHAIGILIDVLRDEAEAAVIRVVDDQARPAALRPGEESDGREQNRK